MQCPRCGATNKEDHAACWKCFAQLSSAPTGKPQEISVKKSEAISAPAPKPESKLPPAEPAPVAEPIMEPIQAVVAQKPEEAHAEEESFSFLNLAPEETQEPEVAKPANVIDLDEPVGGLDITRFLVPELAEKDEKPEEGPESKH